ncbi:uncharacterized protein JCM15063_001559 [Sporobolomyces koalae]|uniref:uncharacterized protein n=1 Tax=Sporobolomyces koalae TaxID=500713 RepID=UPI0031769F2D
MSDDPARTFFPDSDEIPSLYEVLSVIKTATADELKRAYRRLCLAHHPDKATASGLSSEAATLKFQQIGFAYSVLKDDARRGRYDKTGSTSEGSGEGAKTEQEWKDYFKDLWQGEVTGQSIEEFKAKYQGSQEEQDDLFDAYTSAKGDLEIILDSIMCSTHDDEERFVKLINQAIESNELEATSKWKKMSKDTKAKEQRKKKADKEAKEAEKAARELGVHDKLYGDKGKGKGKSKAQGEAGDDEAALKALIQGNRDKRMSSLMDSLEAKYGGGGRGKKRASTGGDGSTKKQKKGEEHDEGPTEEEFARIQAEIDSRRSATGNKQKKGGRKSK